MKVKWLKYGMLGIDENYEGDNREEGSVRANSKYRIQLSLDEARELKFWDYYFNENKPEKIIFGSGLHRYITDIQVAQVLKNKKRYFRRNDF